MKKYNIPFQIMLCATAIVIAGCDSGKKRMLVPPSEPPEPMLVPPAIAIPSDGSTGKVDTANDTFITASGATDVAVESGSQFPEPVSGKSIFYICQSGDTIKSVSEKYNVNINELMSYNKLLPAQSLIPGKILLLPNDLSELATKNNITTYTVVKGDSYSRIARKFNISATALMRLNNTENSKLDVGDVLYVPNVR